MLSVWTAELRFERRPQVFQMLHLHHAHTLDLAWVEL